jgi:hypothetical protein
MKIRTGFVSNSSSSSFVLVATKEAVEAVFQKTSIYVQAVANFVKTETKFLGKEVCIFNGTIGDCSSWDNFNEDDYPIPEDIDGTYEAWEKFADFLKEETKGDMIYEWIEQ